MFPAALSVFGFQPPITAASGIRWRRRARLLAWLFGCLCCGQPLVAGVHTATAVHTNQPQRSFSSGAQPNRTLAAQVAMARCRQALAETNPSDSVCELSLANGQTITSARDIRAKTDDTPLYLWRFASPSATVFVAGTVHVLKEALLPLPNQFIQAYNQTDKLVLEVDLSRHPQAQVQATTLRYAALDNQALRQVMPADLYQRLVAAGLTYGLPVGQLQSYQPMLASQQLTVLGMNALGYDSDFGVEHVITQLGQRDADDILQLETLDFQLKLLFTQPIDTQLAVLDQALDDMADVEWNVSQLMTAYFRGDDDALLRTMTEQTGDHPLVKAFNDQLMNQRNRSMAKTIAGYLQTPHRYLVLVGAGHLVGPNSIIAELGRAGIQGQRIHANQSIDHREH